MNFGIGNGNGHFLEYWILNNRYVLSNLYWVKIRTIQINFLNNYLWQNKNVHSVTVTMYKCPCKRFSLLEMFSIILSITINNTFFFYFAVLCFFLISDFLVSTQLQDKRQRLSIWCYPSTRCFQSDPEPDIIQSLIRVYNNHHGRH